jgi:hypothetical protein
LTPSSPSRWASINFMIVEQSSIVGSLPGPPRACAWAIGTCIGEIARGDFSTADLTDLLQIGGTRWECPAVKGWTAWTPVCAGVTGLWVIPAEAGIQGSHTESVSPRRRASRLLKNSVKCAGCSKSSRCKAAGRKKPERTGSYVRISDDRARSRWTFSAAC